jgi:thiol-disulfide isomerase/thioredoxin
MGKLITSAPLLALAVLLAVSGCARKDSGVQAAPGAADAAAVVPVAAALPPAQASSLLQAVGLQIPKEEIASTDFTLDSLDGRKVSLSSYRGKLVFLNFWATWCPPCRSEMPAMEALYTKLKARGFVIVAVDLAEEARVVSEYVKTKKLTFPVLLDTAGEVGGKYSAQSIPTTYIIDREGRILARGIGAQWKWDSPEMIALFEKLL